MLPLRSRARCCDGSLTSICTCLAAECRLWRWESEDDCGTDYPIKTQVGRFWCSLPRPIDFPSKSVEQLVCDGRRSRDIFLAQDSVCSADLKMRGAKGGAGAGAGGGGAESITLPLAPFQRRCT